MHPKIIFKIKNLIRDNLSIYEIKAIQIMHDAYIMLIIAMTLNFFAAWKYGRIKLKNMPSKNVRNTTRQNNNLLSIEHKQPPKHISIAKNMALTKNNEIFSLTLFELACDETSI